LNVTLFFKILFVTQKKSTKPSFCDKQKIYFPIRTEKNRAEQFQGAVNFMVMVSEQILMI